MELLYLIAIVLLIIIILLCLAFVLIPILLYTVIYCHEQTNKMDWGYQSYEKKKMKRLNIGCENDYKEGWVNVDFDPRYKVDASFNLNNFPYPFPDNTFDEILAAGVLEHLDDFYRVMKELHRIAKDKCKIYILLNHGSDVTVTWGEVEHKRGFSIHTFGSMWCNQEMWSLFNVLKRKISFSFKYKLANAIINPIVNLSPIIWERLFCHYLPCSDVVYILEVIKDPIKIQRKARQLKEHHDRERKKYDPLKFIKEI